MINYVRMLEDRDGAWDHIQVNTYRAGEVYHLGRFDPPISQDLLDGFVASGHAIEVDENGNPTTKAGAKRLTKVVAPDATKSVEDDTPGELAPSARDVILANLRPDTEETPETVVAETVSEATTEEPVAETTETASETK